MITLIKNSDILKLSKLRDTEISVIEYPYISAGFPSPADDFLENSLSVSDFLKTRPASTYFAKCGGDSLKNIGIEKGDVFVIDKSIRPKDGDLVVACINSEFTAKRLRRFKNKIYLCAENEEYEPIEVSEYDELTIWGVICHVIKDLHK